MRALVLAAAAAATLCLVGLTTAPCLVQRQSIDAIIGQGKFNAVFPVTPGSRDDVHRQITQRLVYLESLLRSRDVSTWPAELQAERLKNIERLLDYRLQAKFPTNYDHPDQQLPCFYDRDGHLCAVANLVAKSAGLDMVRAINSRYQYATVSQMKMPELDRWIEQSGLTRSEVITIQEPGFRGTYERVGGNVRLTTSGSLFAADSTAPKTSGTDSDEQANTRLRGVAYNPTSADVAEPETLSERVEKIEPQVR